MGETNDFLKPAPFWEIKLMLHQTRNYNISLPQIGEKGKSSSLLEIGHAEGISYEQNNIEFTEDQMII